MTIPVLAAASGGRNKRFGVATYTGTGASQNIVTGINNSGVGGLVMHKPVTVSSWRWHDTARGAGNYLQSDADNAEQSGGSEVQSFNENGFSGTIGSIDAVAFNWLKEAGYFDIQTYVGNGATQNISHDLGVVPAMIIVKDRTSNFDWRVYHKSLNGGTDPEDYYLRLDTNDAEVNDVSVWNGTAPTSTQFTVGNAGTTNTNLDNYVAYLFAEKAGFSKAGGYTGNGATNAITGLGFEPQAVFLVSRTGGRPRYLAYNDGGTIYYFEVNENTARNTNSTLFTSFGSDGFTVGNSFNVNASGEQYIYFAWR